MTSDWMKEQWWSLFLSLNVFHMIASCSKQFWFEVQIILTSLFLNWTVVVTTHVTHLFLEEKQIFLEPSWHQSFSTPIHDQSFFFHGFNCLKALLRLNLSLAHRILLIFSAVGDFKGDVSVFWLKLWRLIFCSTIHQKWLSSLVPTNYTKNLTILRITISNM